MSRPYAPPTLTALCGARSDHNPDRVCIRDRGEHGMHAARGRIFWGEKLDNEPPLTHDERRRIGLVRP